MTRTAAHARRPTFAGQGMVEEDYALAGAVRANEDSVAHSLQRMVGNQRAGRLSAVEPRIQRNGNGPLLLTDRPWEEIEKERNPARKLFLGEDKSGLPKPDFSQLPIKLQMPVEEPEPAPVDPLTRARNMPLLLYDRKTSRRIHQREKRAEKSAAKRLAAANQPAVPKPQKTNPTQQFYQSMQARLKSIRSMQGAEDFSKEIAELEHGTFMGAVQKGETRQDPGRNAVSGAAGALEGRITIKAREKAAHGLLTPRKQTTIATRNKLRTIVDKLDQAGVQRDKEFFRASGEEATINTKRGELEALRVKAVARLQSINNALAGIQGSTQDSPAAADVAEAAVNVPVDAELDGADPDIAVAETAWTTVTHQGHVRAAKDALIDGYKAPDPRLMRPHVAEYLKLKLRFNMNITRTAAENLANTQLAQQKNIPKAVWMKAVLGYEENKKWNPNNTLYLRPVADVRGFHAHVSVFRGTIVAGGNVPVPQPAATIRDIFFASSADPMQASHLTLEIAEAGSPLNPHVYRGGPSDWGRINTEFGVNAVAAELDMRNELAAELAAALVRIQTAVNDEGIDEWPVYG